MDNTGETLRLLLDLDEPHTILALALFLCFVGVSAITLMNMLIGVLCEVMSSVAQSEKEDCAIRLVKDTILLMLKAFDEDGNGVISRDELRSVMTDPMALS